MRSGKRFVNALLVSLLVLQFLGLTTVRADGFVETPFESQWKATDQDVATGKASRTYFWGPAAFAHTNEMYNESPNNGQRRVQYFDKARMELTKRDGQDPNFVTNGLLTVELVTGRLQVGDSKFLVRASATNQVAGDQVGNERTPTYASFKQGKVVFGVEGAKAASDRTGQAITDAIDNQGQVSTLSQPVVALTYARFFNETGHNLASVFNNFFKVAPLGDDKWLSVMGLPISEPFWAKDQVIVAGQARDVLIQLFERRALTYTPSNPATYQVEMGNIGQHYYAWRYNFDVRGELPGNYRLVYPQTKSLYSVSIYNAQDRIKVGDVASQIRQVWTLANNMVALDTENALMLTDLKTKVFQKLDLPTGLINPVLEKVIASPNGRYVAVMIHTDSGLLVQLYEMQGLSAISSYAALADSDLSFTTVKFSGDSNYLAAIEVSHNADQKSAAHIIDIAAKTNKRIEITDAAANFGIALDWLGQTTSFLVSIARTTAFEGTVADGRLLKIEAGTGTIETLLSGSDFLNVLPSPDGSYFALVSTDNASTVGGLVTATVNVRAISNPTVALLPDYVQGTAGRYSNLPRVAGWSADGTYLVVFSAASGTGGAYYSDINLLSAVNGKIINANHITSSYLGIEQIDMVGTTHLLYGQSVYNGPDRPSNEKINVQNLDGSNKQVLLETTNNRDAVLFGQVVQVVK